MAGLAFRTLGGAGEDLVLIHGFAADRLSWIGLSPELMKVRRVHALDLPGHGDSAAIAPGNGGSAGLAAAVRAAMAEQGIGPAHLLGHSLGGAVAMRMAEEEPARVRSLALIAPAGLGLGPDAAFLAALPAVASPEEAERLLRQLVARPQLINKMTVQRLLDQLGREGVRAALAVIGQALAAERVALAGLALRIGRTDIPRIVLWGNEDAINPIDAAAVAGFGGTLCRIDGAGHLPHIEAPRPVLAALAGFYGQG